MKTFEISDNFSPQIWILSGLAPCFVHFASTSIFPLVAGLIIVNLGFSQCASAIPNAKAVGMRTEMQLTPPVATSIVAVHVRTIEAIGRFDDQGEESVPVRIDGRLADLAEKLRKLPFRSFNLLSSQNIVTPLLRKQQVNLTNGQSLWLRPLYCEENRVGLWIHWQDQGGAEILDTRMHLDMGRGMLVGSDLAANPRNALILALEVDQTH